jgi:drug/metabolite transporter (DMT)-like permease
VLTATLLALGAAVLHAGWNLTVKATSEDRFLMLWGQFFLAATLVIPIVIVAGGIPVGSWAWVAISGSVHLPYCLALARAYDHGDFSLAYPIARGGGAMLAAIGGVLLLGDHLSIVTAIGICIVGGGLLLLAGKGSRTGIVSALIVAATIGVYSVSDAKGIRSSGTPVYALCTHLGTAGSTTAHALATGRRKEMAGVLRRNWRRLLVIAVAATVTYGMVQLAFERAQVGYVTALRESSVVIAAYVGWRRLGEHAGRRRLAATVVVMGGLVTLVAGR